MRASLEQCADGVEATFEGGVVEGAGGEERVRKDERDT
jgi:hypothetical protein